MSCRFPRQPPLGKAIFSILRFKNILTGEMSAAGRGLSQSTKKQGKTNVLANNDVIIVLVQYQYDDRQLNEFLLRFN